MTGNSEMKWWSGNVEYNAPDTLVHSVLLICLTRFSYVDVGGVDRRKTRFHMHYHKQTLCGIRNVNEKDQTKTGHFKEPFMNYKTFLECESDPHPTTYNNFGSAYISTRHYYC